MATTDPALGLKRAPKGVYKVQLAPSGRSACQACQGLIPYGELRLGLLIEKEGYTDWWKWRCWNKSCITTRVVGNIESYENLNGFEDLDEEDQDLVIDMFEAPPEPMPRKKPQKEVAADAEGRGIQPAPRPARKKRAAPKKKAEVDSDGEEIEPAPKRKKAAPRKRKAAPAAAAPAAPAAPMPAPAAVAPAAYSALQQLLAGELARVYQGSIPAELHSYFKPGVPDTQMVLLIQMLTAAAVLPPGWPMVPAAPALPLLPVVAPAPAAAPVADVGAAADVAAPAVKPEPEEVQVARQLDYGAAEVKDEPEPELKEEVKEEEAQAAEQEGLATTKAAEPRRQKRAAGGKAAAAAGKKKRGGVAADADEDWVPQRRMATRSRARRGEQ